MNIEVKEESGYDVSAKKLVALLDVNIKKNKEIVFYWELTNRI
ncbi:hypothetical protein [Virgibacillus sp. L01]